MRHFKYIKVAEDRYELIFTKLEKTNGECDCDRKTIEIDTETLTLPMVAKIETLLHEIIHAVAAHFDLDLKYQNDPTHENLVFFEHVIESTAKGFLMLMVDNRELFKWILNELDKEDARWRGKKQNQKRINRLLKHPKPKQTVSRPHPRHYKTQEEDQ